MRRKTLAKNLTRCRICLSRNLDKFLSLGSMPIPNGFLKKDQLSKKEEHFPLECFVCRDCYLVQLTCVVDPKIMFKNYVYIPSTSKVMMNNFSNLAYLANQKVNLEDNDLVVDIGSNDGSLLRFFKNFGAKVLGIDPAENLAEIAVQSGIPTETRLFNKNSASFMFKKYGRAKIITATNVVAHIDDLHQLIQGVEVLLDKNGIFVTEFPYFLDLVAKNQFDTIYHEHLSYFSLKPWINLLDRYGFEIIEAQRILVHGGSIRLTHRRKSRQTRVKNSTVDYLISLEGEAGLYKKHVYGEFTKRIINLKDTLNRLLKDLKTANKRIVGLGAAAKGNVLTHFFDIGTETLDYIADSTPYKHGLFTPGKHIPVVKEEKVLEDMPDYALILAWNFADEIMEKHKVFKKRGGKFIIPIPEVKVV